MSSQRAQFGRYQIVSPLGAGGMGEVYRAHDPQLRRDVALKILPPHRSSDPDAVARMVREAQLAAAVEHPSIVAVHDVGEEAGQLFLVTELLEGETLRERLRHGPLAIRAALDYAVQIASAIAAAHTRGVVHRDLKPENIMSTASGTIKVLDFGVAKFVTASDATTVVPTIVTGGGAVGTPAYMSPEQLNGRVVDHRADQFAFGVVLYELLAGIRPFSGATAAAVASAILRDEPAPLVARRADVPPTLSRIVSRCLAKNPDDRFASTTDLANALADVRTDLDLLSTPPTPAAAARRPVSAWVGVVTAVVVLAVALAIGLPRSNSAPAVTSSDRAPMTAVAVLPFTTLGNSEAYLADGLTEAVTRELGHIERMRVIASNSAFRFRGREQSLAEVARELGVQVLVRGTVQHAGDRVSINATLISAADGAALWSNQYSRATNDLLAVQDDIAWQVAASLSKTLGMSPPPRRAETPMTTPAAYDAYLRGLSHMRGPSLGFPKGIAELERAVSLDPNFALGQARLASAYTQQFFYNASDPELERRAFIGIQKALTINPDLAEAYLARAQLIWNLRNGFPHERTIADLRRAVANNPNLAEAHIELGKLYYHIGLIDEAIAANRHALVLDPLSSAANQRLIGALVDGRRKDVIAEELSRTPQWPPRSIAGALMLLGRTDEAIAQLAPRGVGDEELRKLEMNEASMLANALARVGRRADADRALGRAIPLAANPTGLSDTHHAQFSIGCAYALLGEHDKAVEWVTKAANEGYPSYARFSTEADLASLRNHPGFAALLERLRKDAERWRATLS